MSSFSDFIKDNIGEFQCNLLDEASSVTFGNKAYPKEGWCVVLAGGPGSGKGYLQKNAILLDGKVHDVDKLKNWYVAAQKAGKFSKEGIVTKRDEEGNPIKYKHVDTHEYNFKNPYDVTKLHTMSNKLDLGDKTEDQFFKANANGHKPNIIFDITGRMTETLIQKAVVAKKAGYKTSFIWVISNRDVAMTQNLNRDRVVGQGLFHRIHNNILEKIPNFIKDITFAELFDEAWLLFASMDKLRDEMTDRDQQRLHDTRAIKLEKKGGVYTIDQKQMKRVLKVLGGKETNPENPEVYDKYEKRQEEINKKKEKNVVQKKKPGLKDFLRTH